MGPKEDPADAKERIRERRKSLLERRDSAEKTAGGLTSDLRAVYGINGISMFGTPETAPAPGAKKKAVLPFGK
jgi:hypothetical protein